VISSETGHSSTWKEQILGGYFEIIGPLLLLRPNIWNNYRTSHYFSAFDAIACEKSLQQGQQMIKLLPRRLCQEIGNDFWKYTRRYTLAILTPICTTADSAQMEHMLR
jgi:hypothetical protein